MKRLLLSMICSGLALMSSQAQEYLYLDGNAIPLSNVVKVTTKTIVSENSLKAVMMRDNAISLYNEALGVTGIMDSLTTYLDETYKWASDKDRIDSCTWTNDRLCIHTSSEYDNVAYPEKRYFNHTMFACPDAVLKDKYGVVKVLGKKDPASLEHLAHQLYDPMYPEDASNDDCTSRKNALNRFMSYHVLNIYGSYYKLTSVDGYEGNNAANNFNREKYDIRDYYETLMPHSIMKCSFPSGSQEGLYINRRGVQSGADEYGVYVRGAKVMDMEYPDVKFEAGNGVYHYIDDVLAYGQTTQQVVLNECIRMDATTLSPDFMTLLTDGQMARGHAGADGKPYQAGGQGSSAASNKTRTVGFKPGFVRNFKYNYMTHMHVRGRVLNYWSYEGDEVIIKGRYDVSVKLPPVPAGTYEVRMMYCSGFQSRGIVATYIDGVPTKITDLRPGGRELFGFKTDSDLGDAEAINSFDILAHNKGWMKGPGCYATGDRSAWDASASTMRNLPNPVRLVIGRFETDGKSDHWLRLQQLMEGIIAELNFDFIELVPTSVCDNEVYPESKM